MHATTTGLDIAKNVFQIHGEDESGQVVFRHRLRRGQLLRFFEKHPPALVGMEACGTAHHWGRELEKLGHRVKLMPPAYVKPFVKRNKTDERDAEACCEAVKRPSIRAVKIKSIAQQCERALQKSRALLIIQLTQLTNSIRAVMAEMGIIAPQGDVGFGKLVAMVEAKDEAIPPALLACLEVMLGQWRGVQEGKRKLDAEIVQKARQSPLMRRLMEVPGVGPITATRRSPPLAMAPSSARHATSPPGLGSLPGSIQAVTRRVREASPAKATWRYDASLYWARVPWYFTPGTASIGRALG